MEPVRIGPGQHAFRRSGGRVFCVQLRAEWLQDLADAGDELPVHRSAFLARRRERDGNLYVSINGFAEVQDVLPISRTGTSQSLHLVSVDDGWVSDLLQSADGTFWGTTSIGGMFGGGTVFSLTSSGVFNSIHSFPAGNVDGSMPRFPLVSIGGDLYRSNEQRRPVRHGDHLPHVTQRCVHRPVHILRPQRRGESQWFDRWTGRNAVRHDAENVHLNSQVIRGTFFRVTPLVHDDVVPHLFQDGGGGPGPLMLASDGYFYGWTSHSPSGAEVGSIPGCGPRVP